MSKTFVAGDFRCRGFWLPGILVAEDLPDIWRGGCRGDQEGVSAKLGRLPQNRQFHQCPLRPLTIRQIEFLASNRSLALNAILQVNNPLDQLFGTGGAARDVHVDGNEPVDSLDNAVGVKDAPGRGASSHGDAPLRFIHLLPDALEHRKHLHHNSPSHDHQVALTRAEPKRFGSEPSDIVTTRSGRHQLDAAAGCCEGHRPKTVLSAPVR